MQDMAGGRTARRRTGRLAAAALLVVLALGAGALPALAQVPPPGVIAIDGVPRVLVFSMTLGFRHPVIPEGNATIAMMGASTGAYNVDISENPQDLTAANLANYDAVVFHSTAGKTPLTDQQREDFIRFAACGGGFVGIAMALDSNYAWPEYTELVGGNVVTHPLTENHDPATRVVVDRPEHPITATAFDDGAVRSVMTREELYVTRLDPRRLGTVRTLMSIDNSTVSEAIQQGPDYVPNGSPVAWTNIFRGRGRSFYQGFGHGDLSWDQPWFRETIDDGIRWVLGPDGHPVDRACAAGEGDIPPAPAPRPAPARTVGRPCALPPETGPARGHYRANLRTLTEEGVEEVLPVGLPGTIFAPNNRYLLDLSGSGARSADLVLTMTWTDQLQDYDLGVTLPWGFAGSSRSPAIHGPGPEVVVLEDVPHCTDFLAAAENFVGAGLLNPALAPTLAIAVAPDV